VTHSADILALLAAGRTPNEAAEALHCPVQRVYDAKWASKHPKRAPYVRPRPRHDLACALLEQEWTYEQIAEYMGCTVRTVQNYTSTVRVGKPPGATEDKYVERPRCRCGLSLPCNDCLPPSAVAYMGRRDEPDACTVGLRP
jgi:DNA-binding CsgD family transcriptional regulator